MSSAPFNAVSNLFDKNQRTATSEFLFWHLPKRKLHMERAGTHANTFATVIVLRALYIHSKITGLFLSHVVSRRKRRTHNRKTSEVGDESSSFRSVIMETHEPKMKLQIKARERKNPDRRRYLCTAEQKHFDTCTRHMHIEKECRRFIAP